MNFRSSQRCCSRWRLTFQLFLGSLLAAAAWAQNGVPIKLTVTGEGYATGDLSIQGDFFPATPGGTNTWRSEVVPASGSPWSTTATFGIMRVEVGKTYAVFVGGTNYLYGTADIIAPQGYRIVMNGSPRKSAPVDGYLEFTLLPMVQHPGLAGMASEISSKGIGWSLALGTLANGTSAGSMTVLDPGWSSSWSTAINDSLISCDGGGEGVNVYRGRNGGGTSVSDITAPQIGVKVTTWSGGFRLDCYAPGNYTSPSSGYPTFSGSPYADYTVQSLSSSSYRIVKNVYGTSGYPTAARTEETSLVRSGTWPAFTWTKKDWTVQGQSALKEVVTVSSAITGGRSESISVKASGGSTIYSLTRTYADTSAGEVQTGETVGTTDAFSADFSYYTNIATPATFGFVETANLGTGNWVANEYYTSAVPSGQVKYQFKPYLNSPSTASQTQGQGEITYFEYVAGLDGTTRPSLVETRVNGTLRSKRSSTYNDTVGSYPYSSEETRLDYTSSGSSLTTKILSYRSDHSNAFFRGQPMGIQTPDGLVKRWSYERGTWASSTFTTGSGTASRIAVYVGAASSSAETESTAYFNVDMNLYLVPGKSTRETTIRDSRALVVRTETAMYTGSAWQLVGYVNYTYDALNQLTSKTDDRGRTWSSVYTAMRKTSDTDDQGVTTSYVYDNAGRVLSETREGYGEIAPVKTTYTYDAMDHVLTSTRRGWGSTEEIVASKSYDDAGRLSSETAPGLGSTTYSYNVSSRTQTTTRPDASTVIVSTYRDGRIASKTGTGIVPEYYTFGVETDGRAWARTDAGTSTSDRWKKSWADWKGRDIKTEIPGFTGQSNRVEEKFYDATTGLLYKQTKTGYAPTRYLYNALAQLSRSGLDVNDNGLVLASDDRIVDNNQYLEFYSSAWWLRTDETKYVTSGSSSTTVTGIKRVRLTGFSSNRVSEVQTTDVEGNVTVETVDTDRGLHTSVKTVSRVGLAAQQAAVSVNGLPVRSQDFDGLITSLVYDTLLRQKQVINSRGNPTTTGYYTGTELKEWVKDGTNQTVASYGYDTSGRVVWQADALNYLTRTSYTTRGQVYRQWGNGTYPVEYGYDSTYGDRTTQSTFRGGTGWDGSTWPGSPGTADTTTWAYDGPSGLMTSKTDALSRATLYTYNVRGQLATREWARLVSSGPSTGQRVKTTYSYNATAGEQTAIDYNDNLTTGLTYTYNRMGQAEYITDVTGVRQFEYCTPCGVVLSETLDSTYFGGRKLTYKRDQSTTGRLGQGIGYQLGTASAPASDQEVTYLYENLNRLTGLTTGFANNSSTRTFRYGYEPDSALLKTLAVEGSPFLVTRTYESDRDYLTSIETQGNSPIETYVRYEYTYDERGQRKTALQAGTAYADYGNSTYRRFSYNGRGELTAALGYMGTDVTQTTDYLPGRQFEYAFDNIGNRQWSNRTGVSSLRDDYTTNALNQYTGRENNTVSISGTATSDAIVAVNGRNVTTGRRGRFWSDEVTVSNVLGPWRGPLSVYAAKPSGGNYVLRLDSRTSQLPPIAETLTYDDDGNPASDGFWTYQWDAENRLIRMETTTVAQTAGVPHRILEFQYDYLGRRVQKRVIDGAASQEISCRRLVYQGWDVIGEYAAAGGSSFGALIRTYTWGLDIARSLADAGGVGALLQISDHASGKSYLPAYDGNGNIAALSNAATGALAAIYEYTPFGESIRTEILDSALTDQPFRFSTKWTDDESGLLNYGRRLYKPLSGRWLSRDRTGEKGGYNLYSFVLNNPPNTFDAHGDIPVLLILAGVGAVQGLAEQFISDLISGQDMQWRNYAVAGTTGAAAGMAVVFVGPTGKVFTNLAKDVATQMLQDAWNNGEVNIRSGFRAAGAGVSGQVGGRVLGPAINRFVRIPGVTSGRNSFAARASRMRTRYANGQIQNAGPRAAGIANVAGVVDAVPNGLANGGYNLGLNSNLSGIGYSGSGVVPAGNVQIGEPTVMTEGVAGATGTPGPGDPATDTSSVQAKFVVTIVRDANGNPQGIINSKGEFVPAQPSEGEGGGAPAGGLSPWQDDEETEDEEEQSIE